ncbi:hypothetical protein HPB49_026358 [Dermacentor silvarum]|nr:hypothetical protein HPB49_026358 [Dermacentor silvarum]
MANAADRTAVGARKKQRLQWSERDTWTLIKPWEDNLRSLRAQKHNGDVYASIAGALTSAGVPRTKEQVHTKIQNLGHTYRMTPPGRANERAAPDGVLAVFNMPAYVPCVGLTLIMQGAPREEASC